MILKINTFFKKISKVPVQSVAINFYHSLFCLRHVLYKACSTSELAKKIGLYSESTGVIVYIKLLFIANTQVDKKKCEGKK